MKVKTMVGTLIFLIVLNIGVVGTIVYLNLADKEPAIARVLNPEPQFEPPFTGQIERIDNLTAEQQQEMVQLIESYQADIKPLQQEIQNLEQELFKHILDQEKGDSANTEKILQKIANLRLKISKHALESLEQSKAFLNDRQQEAFIRRIISTGRRSNFGPGSNVSTPPMLNKRFKNQ